MNMLILLLIVLLLVGGGGGYYYGGPNIGGGIGLVPIVLLVLALMGRLSI